MHANPNKPPHKWALCHYYYLWFDLHVLILVIKPHHTAYQAGGEALRVKLPASRVSEREGND